MDATGWPGGGSRSRLRQKMKGQATLHSTGQARGIDFILAGWFVAANVSHHGASPWSHRKAASGGFNCFALAQRVTRKFAQENRR